MLNSLGKRYVNFEVLKNNVLEDLTSPLEWDCPYHSKSRGMLKNINYPPWPNKRNTSWSITSVW